MLPGWAAQVRKATAATASNAGTNNINVSGAGEAPGFQLDGVWKFQGRSSSMRLLG